MRVAYLKTLGELQNEKQNKPDYQAEIYKNLSQNLIDEEYMSSRTELVELERSVEIQLRYRDALRKKLNILQPKISFKDDFDMNSSECVLSTRYFHKRKTE